MNTKKFSDAMSELDNKYIDEAIQYKGKRKARRFVKWSAAVACLCFIVIAAFTIPVLLNGNEPVRQRPICAYIQEDISSVEISYISGSETTAWKVEGSELETLRKWTNSLQYEAAEFLDGNTPGDNNGGTIYSITIHEGDYPGFTYIMNGDKHYLLIEGYWYTVENPSMPPISLPE